jgi:putative MFS transporter
MNVSASMGEAVASRQADEIVARLERVPFSRFHWNIFVTLGLANIFDGFDTVAIGVTLAVIFSALHIGFVNAGLLISVGGIGGLIGAVASGVLGDKFGRKSVLISAMLLFGLGSLACTLAWDFPSLMIMRAIQGLGLGATLPIAAVLFNEFVRGKSRGLTAGGYQGLFTIGLIVVPFIGGGLIGALGGDLGWRALFAIGGIPALVAIYAIWRLPESVRWLVDKGRFEEAERVVSRMEAQFSSLPEPEVRYRADVKPTRFGELFSRAYARRTILTWLQFSMTLMITGALGAWLPTEYQQVSHVSPELALVLSGFTGLGTLVGGYLFVLLTDRVGRKPLFALGFGIALVGGLFGMIGVGFLQLTSWPVLFTAGLLLWMGGAVNNLGAYVYIAELFPTRMRAWALATGNGANRIAGLIVPTLVGLLLASVLGIAGVFGMLALAALIGLAVILTLGIETKQRVLEELSA